MNYIIFVQLAHFLSENYSDQKGEIQAQKRMTNTLFLQWNKWTFPLSEIKLINGYNGCSKEGCETVRLWGCGWHRGAVSWKSSTDSWVGVPPWMWLPSAAALPALHNWGLELGSHFTTWGFLGAVVTRFCSGTHCRSGLLREINMLPSFLLGTVTTRTYCASGTGQRLDISLLQPVRKT